MDFEHALMNHFVLRQAAVSPQEKEEGTSTLRNPQQEKAIQQVPPPREFEEEIANWLLELKEQDPTSSPKRKSPVSSPVRVENTTSDFSSPLGSPTQKRRRTTKSFETLSDSESHLFAESFENASGLRSRKSNPSSHEDSDFEYDDDEEEAVEHEEEYLEDDDDDWYESLRSTSTSSSSSSSSFSGSSSGRIARKKAPSGSACEKHKRWKKRCPDDCPMRTNNVPRRRKPVSPKTELKDTFAYEAHYDTESQIDDKRMIEIESQDIIKNLFHFVEQARNHSQPTKSDYVSLIRWSLQQLSTEGICYIKAEEFPSIEAAILRKITTGENHEVLSNNSGVRSRRTRAFREETMDALDMLSEVSQEKSITTMACERHTLLHARCPPNCSDRRTVEVLGRGKRKQEAPEIKREAPKAKATKTKRTGRKYLPQACERHKLLHAKCPANCPDRIKRDAELAKHQMQACPSSPLQSANTP